MSAASPTARKLRLLNGLSVSITEMGWQSNPINNVNANFDKFMMYSCFNELPAYLGDN